MIKRELYKLILIILFLTSTKILAKEEWVLDKNLSSIEFELPVLFAHNVKGEFKKIDGLVQMDSNRKNNKAIFSVELSSIDMNYKKYKNLLLSNIFFNINKNPIALVDTQTFSYENEKDLNLIVELTIRGITKKVPLKLEINHLTKNLVQIKGKLLFSRTDFQIGSGVWSSTSILKDKASIKTNLFLFKL